MPSKSRQFTRCLTRVAVVLCLSATAVLARAADILPYKDTSLPFEARVADLVGRMTFEEKAAQIQVVIPANDRLGLPACRWGTEAMHGLPGGTTFPDSMAMAATWDPEMVGKIATAIGDEARARANPSNGAVGYILWCPNMNLARDPRWGRNQETYGEDAYLSGRLGIAYVKGLQGDDPKYLKTLATPKHFAVYSQENARASSNAAVSQRALHEYYLRPFEDCFVEGGALSTMSAYNAINGIPCSGSEWLLTTMLRKEWHFQGAVVTDSRAVNQIFSSQNFTDSEEKAVALAINSGVDLITDLTPARITPIILQAQQQNLFKPGAVDRAVKQSLLMRFRLGQFDPPEMVPYSKIPPSVVSSAPHMDIALRSAREAITLLQNEVAHKGYGFERLLPLDPRRVSSIAVVGPNAPLGLYGSYPNGAARGGFTGTFAGPARSNVPLEAIKYLVGERIIVRNVAASDTDAVVEAARISDVVIFVGGLDARFDRSGADRISLELPLDQSSLIDKIVKVNPLTIVVLNGGSAISLESIKSKVPAIVMMWYNGEQGGTALADVLLGRHNPAGRLPVTFYKSIADLPPMDDYELTSGRTYMYINKPVSFPFGHGLSYTTFAYDNFKITPPASPGAPPAVTVDVTNTGSREGDEVVQLYVHKVESAIPRPLKQLVGFRRVNIPAGKKITVTLPVDTRGLAYWNVDERKFITDPGAYELMAGASSEDIRLRGSLTLK